MKPFYILRETNDFYDLLNENLKLHYMNAHRIHEAKIMANCNRRLMNFEYFSGIIGINNIVILHKFYLNIYKFDYDKMSQQMFDSGFSEELVKKVFNPQRILKICDTYNIDFCEWMINVAQ